MTKEESNKNINLDSSKTKRRMNVRKIVMPGIVEAAIVAGDVEECEWALSSSGLEIKDMVFEIEDTSINKYGETVSCNAMELVAAECSSDTCQEMVAYLLRLGADIDKGISGLGTPVEIACLKKNKTSFAAMMANGAIPFPNGNECKTKHFFDNLLFRSVRHDDDMDFMKFLLEYPCIADRLNDCFPWGPGEIPTLFMATIDTSTLKKFTKLPGVNVKVYGTDSEGNGKNALHWLLLNPGTGPWKERYNILRKHGVSLTDKDEHGKTPFEYARERTFFSAGDLRMIEKDTLDEISKSNGRSFSKKCNDSFI